MSLPMTVLRSLRLHYSSLPKYGYNVKRALERAKKEEDAEALNKIMENRRIQEPCDVTLLKNTMLNSERHFPPKSIDRILLNYFIAAKDYGSGLKYIEYLDDETKKKSNLFLTNQIFRMYFYKRYAENGLSQDKMNYLIKLYDDLKKSFPILDPATLENAILALSVTKKWKLCLDLLDEVRKFDNPNSVALSALMAAAILNNEDKLTWKIFDQLFETDKQPKQLVFSAYIERLSKIRNKKEVFKELEKLFQKCSEKEIIFNEVIVLKLKDLLEKLNIHSQLSSINKRGACTSCWGNLENLEPTAEVFEQLKQKIISNVIVGSNIFSKTTPEEFAKFQNFLKNVDNYDVVIDGLNVAYTAGTQQSAKVYATLLFHVVAHFIDKGKKVVVLGRAHMSRWPKIYWNYIVKNCKIFLTQDLSQDDPYLLYCALHCGKDTIIVSRDLMRSHLFLLKDPKDKLMFSRWLYQRQHQLNFVTNEGKVHFKYPAPCTRTIQKNGDYWHIPYNLPEKDGKNEISNTWLCVRSPNIS